MSTRAFLAADATDNPLNTARIWDAATGGEIKVLRGHESTGLYVPAY
jgi:hypothetical protein